MAAQQGAAMRFPDLAGLGLRHFRCDRMAARLPRGAAILAAGRPGLAMRAIVIYHSPEIFP
jgi:hypothetical protein